MKFENTYNNHFKLKTSPNVQIKLFLRVRSMDNHEKIEGMIEQIGDKLLMYRDTIERILRMSRDTASLINAISDRDTRALILSNVLETIISETDIPLFTATGIIESIKSKLLLDLVLQGEAYDRILQNYLRFKVNNT